MNENELGADSTDAPTNKNESVSGERAENGLEDNTVQEEPSLESTTREEIPLSDPQISSEDVISKDSCTVIDQIVENNKETCKSLPEVVEEEAQELINIELGSEVVNERSQIEDEPMDVQQENVIDDEKNASPVEQLKSAEPFSPSVVQETNPVPKDDSTTENKTLEESANEFPSEVQPETVEVELTDKPEELIEKVTSNVADGAESKEVRDDSFVEPVNNSTSSLEATVEEKNEYRLVKSPEPVEEGTLIEKKSCELLIESDSVTETENKLDKAEVSEIVKPIDVETTDENNDGSENTTSSSSSILEQPLVPNPCQDATVEVPDSSMGDSTEKPVNHEEPEAMEVDEVEETNDTVDKKIEDSEKIVEKQVKVIAETNAKSPSLKEISHPIEDSKKEQPRTRSQAKESTRNKSSFATPSNIISVDEVEEVVEVDTITGPKSLCIVSNESLIDHQVNHSPARAPSLVVRNLVPLDEPKNQLCAQCKRMKLCRFGTGTTVFCSELCHTEFTRFGPESSGLPRRCAQCHAPVFHNHCGSLSWETMDFCKVECLGQYQAANGSECVKCLTKVRSANIGRFCVRFGHDVMQFCSSKCLEDHKKVLKMCAYCQKDISNGVDSFLAQLAESQFKDFCSQSCLSKFKAMGTVAAPTVDACAVCGVQKQVVVEVLKSGKLHSLCSEPCFAAFKFVNNVSEGRCDQCNMYFDKVEASEVTAFFDDRPRTFCSRTCLNVYILANRKIVPCSYCKVKKYNFDLIKKTELDGTFYTCSVTCLKKCERQGSGAIRQCVCHQCGITGPSQCQTSTKGIISYFCSFKCAAIFKQNEIPSSLLSPAAPIIQTHSIGTVPPKIYQHIMTKPEPPKDVKNKAILCKPYMHNKGTSCRPMPCHKGTNTDCSLSLQALIPVPVPIYIPAPMHMYSLPYPVPVPIPLPVPVPIFIPTTRNSAKGILKEIKKIQEKIPTDPFEAELLMMAEMVAGEKKQDVTDSESDGDGNDGHDGGDDDGETFSPEAVDSSNAFGDDMLQIALKMASELDEPAVDMESVLTSNTITPSAPPPVDAKALYGGVAPVQEEAAHTLAMMRGRKRPMRGGRGGGQQSKRGRRTSGPEHGMSAMPNMNNMSHIPQPEPPRIEVEKPDANMKLKYTFGVNAWRHWVMQKNIELEKAMLSNRKIKPFKPDLLQLTADELNFSLCLFVKEVKKPNGQEYAPDTIYYLCLGIQQYLFENGRIDNIFTDIYYEKFTDCLDEVAKRFAVLYNDSQYIVTRVEEEHLWESKQLGAHSPHVLLSTLMFFNTKHFNLVTVEEHMQLSFSHIMKHWKRNPNSPGVAKVPGSRNVLLRFYPPQSALEANSRKKKVYEQQENEENPLRCPVKLYEFYLSKCPESVKTRNDVFYLLPERSCVPDSPVWYSTMALGKEPLMKMLHRVKMVKEINLALITS